MFAWLKKIAAPVAAVAVIGFGTAAHAVNVEYYTYGYFSDSAAPFNGGTVSFDPVAPVPPVAYPYPGSHAVTVNSGPDLQSSTLTYNWSGYRQFNIPTNGSFNTPYAGDFGTFNIESDDVAMPYDAFNGIEFTLQIYQLDPNSPGSPATLAATLSGELLAGPFSINMVLDFEEVIATLPGDLVVQYKILEADTDGDGVTGVEIQGDNSPLTAGIKVTPVPLPSAATVAVPLLVGFGLLSRRRKVSVA